MRFHIKCCLFCIGEISIRFLLADSDHMGKTLHLFIDYRISMVIALSLTENRCLVRDM